LKNMNRRSVPTAPPRQRYAASDRASPALRTGTPRVVPRRMRRASTRPRESRRLLVASSCQ
jgi:hypothetical protein